MKKKDLYNLLPVNDMKLIVGVSGGADSILLFTQLIEKGFKERLVVAHINHGMRKESQEEYLYVKELCLHYDVRLEYKELHLDVNASEKTARDARYSFYKEIMFKYNTHYLLLGHHADDLIEGVYMRFTSGSYYKGLINLSFKNVVDGMEVYRPLLQYTKDEVYNECNLKGLKWYEDTTNRTMVYTRNRYRNAIVPLLKEENPNLHSTILQFAQLKSEEEDYFDTVVNETFEKIITPFQGMLEMKKEEFNQLHVTIQKRLLRKIFNVLGKDYVDNNILEKYVEKTSNERNTDFNLLYKGFYLVQTKEFVYFINETTKNSLESVTVYNELSKEEQVRANKKMQKNKVPSAFRKILYTKGDCVVDIYNTILL